MNYKLVCTYKDRTPNPGVCTIIEINFETKKLEVSNGAVRLFPNFDDVEIFKVKKIKKDGNLVLKKLKIQ